MKKNGGMTRKTEWKERFADILYTLFIVAAASLFCLLLNEAGVMKENVLMVFLIGVLLVGAFTSGYEYGIIGAVVSVLLFNYFFTVPVHTFAIMNPDDVVSLSIRLRS